MTNIKDLPAPIIQMALELNNAPEYAQSDIDTFTAKDQKRYLCL